MNAERVRNNRQDAKCKGYRSIAKKGLRMARYNQPSSALQGAATYNMRERRGASLEDRRRRQW
jgi:hypothetical protein